MVEHDRSDPGPGAGGCQFRQRLGPHDLVGLRRFDQRLVGGKHHIGAHSRSKRFVRSGVGWLGEDDVEADRPGACLPQRGDKPRVQVARPRPLQAEFRQRRLVDRHDDRPVRRTGRRQGGRKIVVGARFHQSPWRRLRKRGHSRGGKRCDQADAVAALAPAGTAIPHLIAEKPFPPRLRRGHQNRTLNEPTKLRPQPGVLGATSNSSLNRL